MANGKTEEIPWDFARHFADPVYRARSEAAAGRGRRALGERLRAARGRAALTQRQLSERSGVHRVTVARIETGEHLPRYDTLVALADALELPLSKLLDG